MRTFIFSVTAPKTKRYGKGERIVPLFPEVRDELESLHAIASPGIETPIDSFVITRYRCKESNLRTQLGRIAEKAGVKPWGKPFMAMRASRRTELENSGRFPNHVLNDWFGHSGKIAARHYLKTTEANFDEATGGPVGGPITSGTGGGTSPQKNPLTPYETPGGVYRYTRRDSRPRTHTVLNADFRAAVVTRVVTDLHQAHPGAAELLIIFQALHSTTQANLLAIAQGLAAAKHDE